MELIGVRIHIGHCTVGGQQHTDVILFLTSKSPHRRRTLNLRFHRCSPKGRNGKHKAIVTKILSDLDQILNGIALKVAAGAARGEQGERPVGVEPCDSQAWAPRCDRQ